MSLVLILCPTYDHCEALIASIASVRAQTFQNWEMVVLCDGSPPRTTEILEAIKSKDDRIRSVSFPKSERFGENYRDIEIKKSTAEFVLHLSDDDLWLPRHIECMLELLKLGDWVNQAPLRIGEHGEQEWWFVNHGTPTMREACAVRKPLSVGINYAAYSKQAYLRLRKGWTCAPWSAGTSDVYMWSKFFRQGGFNIASNARTTALKFPSKFGSRSSWSSLDRVVELSPWLARAADPKLERNLQKSSSILNRLLGIFSLHGPGETWEASMQKSGLRPVAETEKPNIGVNGATMDVPLAPAQIIEAKMAHSFVSVMMGKAPTLEESVALNAAAEPWRWASMVRGLSALVNPNLAIFGLEMLARQTDSPEIFNQQARKLGGN